MFTLKIIHNSGIVSVSQWDTVSFSPGNLNSDKDSTFVGCIRCQPDFKEFNVDLKDAFYVIDQFGNTVLSKREDVRGAC